MLSETKTKQFYNRAAFGAPLFNNVESTVQSLLRSHSNFKEINIVDHPASDMATARDTEMIEEKQKRNRSQFIELNTTWFTQLTDPQLMVREKMAFFWHDHFACQVRQPYLAQQQINTIRKHALGNFRDLLMAVSKDPAMLLFLNNQQNRKDSPNENFAREVMELFTLGRGNYSEEDIKNAARAFTGWGFNLVTATYRFRANVHDDGVKTFRGKSGRFNGDDIIDLILEDRQTAHFITQKIASFFVGDVNKEVLATWSSKFFQSGYDIGLLVEAIYSSAEFTRAELVGNRIKSPVELIAGIQTHTAGSFHNPLNIIFLQRALGQTLLQPPNVSGWPNGHEWIDSSSLAFRMTLPATLFKNADIAFEAKDDGDANNDTNRANRPGNILFAVDFEALAEKFTKQSAEATLAEIQEHLLACPLLPGNQTNVSKAVIKSANDAEFVKRAYMALMALPEYQLS